MAHIVARAATIASGANKDEGLNFWHVRLLRRV
jgi:hypothetical protein